MERKLAVILVADIVGYSAQMEKDEAGTYARVTARRRDIFEPEIARHQGRIFKLVGDGLLAEFGSAVQAVECAMALQRSLAERNADVAQDQRILARIGINLGEVIVEGDDRLGEGVNIAARLEQLAEPGGICVSEKVAREVERKLAFGFESMGERRVKNIAEPIHVYRVSADATKAMRPQSAPARWRAKWRWGVLGALLSIGVVVAGMAGQWRWVDASFQAAMNTREGLPILQVHAFDVADGLPVWDESGEDVASDIVTVLSTSPDLAQVTGGWPGNVVASGKVVPDYILTGRLTREGDAFGLYATLSDAVTSEKLWSGHRSFSEAELEAELASFSGRVYASLMGARGELLRLEEARTWQKPPEALTEYDYHLRGAVRLANGSDVGRTDGRDIWRVGLERFPDSALLRLDIAEAMYRQAQVEPVATAAQTISSAWHLMLQAEQQYDRQPEMLQRALGFRNYHLSAMLMPVMMGDFEAAVVAANLAHGRTPHDPQINADLSLVLANAGYFSTAIKWARFAVETQYNPPDDFHATLGWALYLNDQPAEAVAAFARMADPVTAEHAAALIAAGRRSEGEAMVAALRARDSSAMSAQRLLFGTGGRVFRVADDKIRLEIDLAGFIEGAEKVTKRNAAKVNEPLMKRNSRTVPRNGQQDPLMHKGKSDAF